MKPLILASIFSFSSIAALAQPSELPPAPDDSEPEAFAFVEQMPEFPGGQDSLLRYLGSIHYPDLARFKDIEGSVYIKFVIDLTGSVTDVKVAKGAHPFLNEAAAEHVSKMPPWKPGYQEGKPVRVQYVVPIKFRLD